MIIKLLLLNPIHLKVEVTAIASSVDAHFLKSLKRLGQKIETHDQRYVAVQEFVAEDLRKKVLAKLEGDFGVIINKYSKPDFGKLVLPEEKQDYHFDFDVMIVNAKNLSIPKVHNFDSSVSVFQVPLQIMEKYIDDIDTSHRIGNDRDGVGQKFVSIRQRPADLAEVKSNFQKEYERYVSENQ